MDYGRIYREFILDRRLKECLLEDGYETHHIEPISLGGLNVPENLVKLSRADHLFAHVLLARIHGGPMSIALVLMLDLRKYAGRRSRLRYNAFRRIHASFMSEITKTRMGTSEAREKNRQEGIKRMSDPVRRAAHSANMTGRKRSPESCAKQGATILRLGKKDSPETRAKKSAAATASNLRPEVRATQREKKLGNKHALGHRHTEESKILMRIKRLETLERKRQIQVNAYLVEPWL